jgi:toxin CptA
LPRKLELPLILEPKISRRLLFLVLFLHGLALCVLFALSVHWTVKLALASIVAASVYLLYARYVERGGKKAIKKLLLRSDNTWILSTGDCAHVQAVLGKDSYVHPFMMILNFICRDHRRRSIVLMGDALEPHLLRKLRVRLRTGQLNRQEGVF